MKNMSDAEIRLPEVPQMPPNTNYADMHRVVITAKKEGLNDQIRLISNGDGTFRKVAGKEGVRVGTNKPRTLGTYAEEDFAREYQHLLEQGFRLTFDKAPAEGKIVTEGNYAPMPDPETDRVIKGLVAVSRQRFEEMYTVSTKRVTEIPAENIAEARKIISAMSSVGDKVSVKEFNKALTTLYEILPRRIDNLQKLIAHSPEDYKAVIVRESDAINELESQIRMAEQNTIIRSKKPDYCTAHGFSFTPVTPEEKEEIFDHLHGSDSGDTYDRRGSYIAAWRVVNYKCSEAYDRFCEAHGIDTSAGYGAPCEATGQHLLFHGSGTENWANILVTGYMLNPDADICGKSLGNGIYQAPSAEKSAGYISGSGRWRAANGQVASFMALNEVATGNIYDYMKEGRCRPDDAEDLERIKPGANSLWYRGGYGGFAHDEVVVYREDQIRIKYLIEIAA